MNGRTVYLVCYDISDPRRLRKIYRLMRGFGEHWQYSVFRCELSEARKVQLLSRVDEIINHQEDQVLVAPLGPAGGKNEGRIEVVGRRLNHSEHKAKVI